MEDTQSFRSIETMNTVEITPKHVDGQNIVYWEDIEQVFPGVKYVKDGKVAINMMRDSDGATDLNVNPPANSTATLTGSASGLSSAEPRQAIVTRENTHIQNQSISLAATIEQARQSEKPLTSEALSPLIASKLTPTLMVKSGFERTVVHKLDGLYDQGAMTQQIARKVLELQKQMNDRLILIQSKTEAILTQQLELTEYPIPRLFIVLPEEPAKFDPGNWFRTKFRLHFICECGKHTEPINSKVPHHLHLAKHEGYLIRQPTELFKKYGPFLLLMLELIKCGTSIAGFVVPTLASLKVVELSVKQSVELVTAKINYSLECIDNQLAKVQALSPGDFIDTEPRAAVTQQDLVNYLSDVEGLEGVELRQLGSFLKTYQEKDIQKLRDVVKLAEGEFDEQLGRFTITLTSSFAAIEFYNALCKAKGVLELIMDWDWKCTRSDLEKLENALKPSRVSILRLDLRQFQTSLIPTSTDYDVISRIRDLPSMKVFHILLSRDLRLPQTKLSCACKMSYELASKLIQGREFRILADTLKTNLTLITLNLYHNSIGSDGAKALAEALKTNSALTTLNLHNSSIGDDGAKALAEALKTNSALTTLNLHNNSTGSDGAKALAEALKTNSALTTLNLRYSSIGSDGAKALAEALKTNSTLTTLDLQYNSIGDNGAVALSKALKINSTLTTLDLQYNSIGSDGTKALSKVPKACTINYEQ
ncbi:hypothetical protein EC957_009341 [Mortierella hygrophila]|uniref:RNI-like protein n=1 Tax=Mortierella hygrophila TaxID=979708 RepID=A0A9P6EWH9_9FUNG|nr:hypothetical protein EC957_009341 [Mortierella hygrophila]